MMQFYEKVNEERKRQGISKYDLTLMCTASGANIREVLDGEKEPTRGLAERICKALGIEWDLTEFVTNKRAKRAASPKSRGKLEVDERAARELGISYGVYCAYRDTGYLKTFIADQEARKQAEAARKVNVIESNIIGGSRSTTAHSLGTGKRGEEAKSELLQDGIREAASKEERHDANSA